MDLTQNTSRLEKKLMAQASQKKVPINGSIELLPLCNMNCDMCYVRLSREEMEKQGRLRTANEWLKIASEMKDAGVLFLLLTGGEPLLYPEFRELYLGLLKLGFILTINTNATLIDEDFALFLAQNKPRRVNVTLYGSNENAYNNLCHYPNGFNKAIHGIQLLKENNIDVKISGSLTPQNQHDIENIISLGDKLGIPVRIDTYMMPATRERSLPFNKQSRVDPETAAEVRIRSLQREMDPKTFRQFVIQNIALANDMHRLPKPRCMSCYAGNCSFSINWQGAMRPCVILSEPSISVFETGFEKSWKYIMEESSKLLINEKCSTCKISSLCRTCVACGLLEAGTFDALPTYMCRYTAKSWEIIEKIFQDNF